MYLFVVSKSRFYFLILALALESRYLDVVHIERYEQLLTRSRSMPPSIVIFIDVVVSISHIEYIVQLRSSIPSMAKVYIVNHIYNSDVVTMSLGCGINQYMTFPIHIGYLRNKVLNDLNLHIIQN